MKKFILLLCILIVLLSFTTGCNDENPPNNGFDEYGDPFSISPSDTSNQENSSANDSLADTQFWWIETNMRTYYYDNQLKEDYELGAGFFVWEKKSYPIPETDQLYEETYNGTQYYDYFRYDNPYGYEMWGDVVPQGTLISIDFGEPYPDNVTIYRDDCTYESMVDVRLPMMIETSLYSDGKVSFNVDFGTENLIYYRVFYSWTRFNGFYSASSSFIFRKP